MNTIQLTDIDEVRGVNHEICHDILMNASMCALESVPKWLSEILENHHKEQLVSLH